MAKSCARTSAVWPMFNPQVGSVRPSCSAGIGLRKAGRNFASICSRPHDRLLLAEFDQQILKPRIGTGTGRWTSTPCRRRRSTSERPVANRLPRRDDRLPIPECAVAMDGMGDAVLRNAGLERDHPADVRRVRRTGDVAEHDFVDVVRLESRPVQRRDDAPAGRVRPPARQPAHRTIWRTASACRRQSRAAAAKMCWKLSWCVLQEPSTCSKRGLRSPRTACDSSFIVRGSVPHASAPRNFTPQALCPGNSAANRLRRLR